MSFCLRVFLGLAVTVLAGCQTPTHREITEAELAAGYDSFVASYAADLTASEVVSRRRLEQEYRSADSANPQSYDVLVLSGGGAFGAFGAGFLQGWGTVQDAEFARPRFDTVSGISTGAMIAPYAFVGTPEAYETIVFFYQNPGDSWVRRRGIIPYLPGNVSVYDVSNLHDQIRSAVTPELIDGLAHGAGEDRQLLIGATNVDYGLLRVWDLAKAARDKSLKESSELTVSTLLASSAIPGAFPPILIDRLMYVDGGAAMSVVGSTDDRNWAYKVSREDDFSYLTEGAPIRIRIWMIVNQKLLPEPKVVSPRWTSVAASSLDTLIKTSTLQSIESADSYVRLMNQKPYIDAKMHYVSIPQDYAIKQGDGLFAPEMMRDLVELGRRMGADPDSWTSKALLPAAPFLSQ
jgi:predicted acylesterase/phospholipase RssA